MVPAPGLRKALCRGVGEVSFQEARPRRRVLRERPIEGPDRGRGRTQFPRLDHSQCRALARALDFEVGGLLLMIVVLLPAYNEEESLPILLPKIEQFFA